MIGAESVETETVPLFWQLMLFTLAVTDQEYVPTLEYTWLGFCCVEVAPSPKVHAYPTEPLQFDGVAVAVKETAEPTAPEAGAAAAHVKEQEAPPEIEIVPFLWQLTPPMLAVTDQEYVPALV